MVFLSNYHKHIREFIQFNQTRIFPFFIVLFFIFVN